MSINVNVHNPKVQADELGVYRNKSQGNLVISLETQRGAGQVILFLTDEQWDAITARVDAFRESEQRVCTVCGDTEKWCDQGPYESDLADVSALYETEE